MAAGALRCGIRTVPVAQQQYHDSLGAAAPQRFGQRHARHGAASGADVGCGNGRPAVPYIRRRDYCGAYVRRRRLRCDGSCRFGFAHSSAAARGVEAQISEDRRSAATVITFYLSVCLGLIRLKGSFTTPNNASENIPPDIFEVPSVRSMNIIETSRIANPSLHAEYFISI